LAAENLTNGLLATANGSEDLEAFGAKQRRDSVAKQPDVLDEYER
jgi:hypothetical protein